MGNLQTPPSVQRLQTALHAKANEEPRYQFYLLYDKVYRTDILTYAYHCCKANKGAAGWTGRCSTTLRRTAKQAVAVTRTRCWQYSWMVEFDIKAAFDQIDHGLLMKAVRTHIREDWILLYIERWLTAPFETADGTRLQRERVHPRGGVVSPILMNLFMHYAFDC